MVDGGTMGMSRTTFFLWGREHRRCGGAKRHGMFREIRWLVWLECGVGEGETIDTGNVAQGQLRTGLYVA